MRRAISASISLAALACGVATLEPRLRTVGTAPPDTADAQPLKAHMRSGDVYLVRSWRLRDSAGALTLEGVGVRYGIDRARKDSGQFAIPADSIALLETSTKGAAFPKGLQALAVWTTIMGTVSGICVADPKSCFGSCPTFYLEGDGSAVPAAEGFSASVAKVLEARDIDALYHARPRGRRFAVRMRNEALETHAVRHVGLLVARRPPGGRVFAGADGRFYPAVDIVAPARCRASGGDCLQAVEAMDGLERVSLADSSDLAARETVELEFPEVESPSGIMIGARHTLLTTFVFYQTLAYMGRGAGAWFAALERAGPAHAAAALAAAGLLGSIEVEVAAGDGPWLAVGRFREDGPIATDVQVIPLDVGPTTGPLRVRLRLAKGNWRLGYVALARLGEPVTPIALAPDRVDRASQPDDGAVAALRPGGRYLVTYPGDAYRIGFTLPEDGEGLELFLESQGYYYEWMRSEWLAEENPVMAATVLTRPAEALRVLAPQFKQREATMERTFWQSRFGR